jgi:hypothetical protein
MLDLGNVRMGYQSGSDAPYFKSASNGQKLFFPSGYWGRGYVLASDHDYERLRRELRRSQLFFTLLTVVLMPVAMIQQHWIMACCCFVTLFIALSTARTRHLVAGLERSNERLSPQEYWTYLAVRHGAFRLWAVELIALVFMGTCILLLVSGRSEWPMVLLIIIFSGLGAGISGYLLVLRRRAARRLS